MFSLSPHKISIYRQCPRRYKYHYVDGLFEPYRKWWPFYTMGAHVHGALSHFLSRINRDRSLARLETLLSQRWPSERRGFASQAEEEEYQRRALAQLRWFHAHEDTTACPKMVEATHRVALAPDLSLTGRVDRIDREEDGSLHLIDYKTSKSGAYADDFQLRIYAVLLSKRYRVTVSRASYLFLSGDGWVSFEPSAADLARTEAELVALKETILAERDFLPRLNRFCHWCDFLELCDVAAAEPWYDMVDDASSAWEEVVG